MLWKAGAAKGALPIPLGVPMDGYGSRTEGSVGTLDPVEVNVLYLSTSVAGQQAAPTKGVLLISLDLLAIDRAWVTCLRDVLHQRFRLKPQNVLVAASHTHAGPAGFRRHGSQRKIDPELRRSLRRSVLKATLDSVDRALRGTQEAWILLGRSTVSGVGTNRHDPYLAADTSLTVLRVIGNQGECLAVLWHYACHPTVLSAQNRLLSPDLPGEVRKWLRAETREDLGGGEREKDLGLPVLYLNGAAADVSTRFTRHEATPKELARLGQGLYEQFPRHDEELLPAIPESRLVKVPVTRARPEDPKRAQLGLEEAEEEYAKALAAGLPAADLRLYEVHVTGTRKKLKRALHKERVPRSSPLQVVSLGTLGLAALPGEVYADQGLLLREGSPFRDTLLVGYAGDYLGYLTSGAENRGYEADSALLAAGTGRQLIGEASHLLQQISKGKDNQIKEESL